ncbi:gallate dioxygenase [Xylophilus rhododendri]|uniref:Gallate dioxygenase n=1 Tax=Xylophilus rhododendri TaxID=2697032 RepID=A0A857J6P1_9BURK|nr:gallate dioxygenase [Xylophilus rhododendri]QHI98475.1 gallate dioxygenase [Xylophilus rhododendri]
MARIIGGIGASHTPTIGFAFDRASEDDPQWGPVFAAFRPAREWLEAQQPDAIVMVYNDHVTSFFFDHYSAFALGIGERYAVADEGGGARALPPIAGHGALARHIGRSMVAEEFDLSFFQDKALDHGCFSPLSMLCRHQPQWPAPIVPLQVGVLQAPAPSARRCLKFGRALRRAIESFPEPDLRVAIVATGGLSHQVHGERSGYNDQDWDARLLDMVQNDPDRLAELTLGEYAGLGGYESAEVVMWLVMRGALSASVRCVHRSYTLPSMTGIATLVLENQASAPVAGELGRHQELIARQQQGPELAGTYPFDLERSVGSYRIGKFLHGLIQPARRKAFLADEEGVLAAADLSPRERELIRQRDWQGLIRYGVIFFLLEKLGAVVGVPNLEIYAAMRDEPLEAFLRTRQVPLSYSVAGAAEEQRDT